jgi:hypothetical protein
VAHHLLDERTRTRRQALYAVHHLALDARAHFTQEALRALEHLVELARGVRLRHATKD